MKRNAAFLILLCLVFSLAVSACSALPTASGSNADGKNPGPENRSPETAKYFYDGIEDLSRYLELPPYEKLILDGNPEATEEEIEGYIQNALNQNPGMNRITDRPVAKGDTVGITFIGTVDGEVDENCTYENADNLYKCTVGSGGFIPGFEDGLIGVMPGSTVTLNLTFPTENYDEAYAGKDVTFEITVYEIQETFIPELTDAFVQSLQLSDGENSVTTVEEFRAYAKKAVEESTAGQIRNNPDYYIWKLVAETAVVKEYPQSEIDAYIKDETEYYQNYASMYGMEFAEFLAYNGKTEEEFDELVNENARLYVRDCLVAEKILRDHNLYFTEEEYAEMLEDFALDNSMESGQAAVDAYGDTFMRTYFVTDRAIEYLKDTIKIDGVSESDRDSDENDASNGLMISWPIIISCIVIVAALIVILIVLIIRSEKKDRNTASESDSLPESSSVEFPSEGDTLETPEPSEKSVSETPSFFERILEEDADETAEEEVSAADGEPETASAETEPEAAGPEDAESAEEPVNESIDPEDDAGEASETNAE